MLTLEQALAQLPDSADGIAAYLIEQKCRGVRADSCYCPIAKYLDGAGFGSASVADVAVEAYIGDIWYGADNPPHITEFVRRFDKGEWPELALTEGEEV